MGQPDKLLSESIHLTVGASNSGQANLSNHQEKASAMTSNDLTSDGTCEKASTTTGTNLTSDKTLVANAKPDIENSATSNVKENSSILEMSDYMQKKQENIQCNEELLWEIGMQEAYDDLMKDMHTLKPSGKTSKAKVSSIIHFLWNILTRSFLSA